MLDVHLSGGAVRQMVALVITLLGVLLLVQLALILESTPAASHATTSVDFADADGDGVRDSAEVPGDTDGDGVRDVDDPDDDGDGVPTAEENADPNGDGFPADAVDSDGDAQPDFLDGSGGHHTDLAAPVRVERMDAQSDGARFGTPEAIGDVNGDGVVDLAVGAFSDDGAGEDVGALWVLLMATDGTVKDARRISAGVAGFSGGLLEGGRFGFRIAGLGDLDGDGVPDLAVSAYRSDRVHAGAGEVWVLFLNPDATVKDWQVITEGFGGLEADLRAGDEFGVDVASVGDLDSDGVPDLAVGMWRRDGLAEDDGGVLMLFLRPDGTVKDYQEISAVAGWADSPVAGGSGFGVAVDGIGDMNGDGIPDLAIGSIGVKNDRGKVWIMTLAANGTVSASQPVTPGRGAVPEVAAGGRFGSSLASLGDIDGDGTLELAVGAFGVGDSTGAAWILDLDAGGAVVASTPISVPGIEAGDLFGHTLASMGDLNGDGAIDLVVGAPGEHSKGAGNGSIYLIYSGVTPTSGVPAADAVDVDEVDVAPDTSDDAQPDDGPTGDLDGDGLSNAIEGVGDIDADGITNREDLDSDGDGIPDSVEGLRDTDGDGIADFVEIDDDGDGILTAVEGTGDDDGDGVPNHRDYDVPVVAEHVHPPAQVLGRVVEREDARLVVDRPDPWFSDTQDDRSEMSAELVREAAARPQARVVPAQQPAPPTETGFAQFDASAAALVPVGAAPTWTAGGPGGTGSAKAIALIASLLVIAGGAAVHFLQRRRVDNRAHMGRHAA